MGASSGNYVQEIYRQVAETTDYLKIIAIGWGASAFTNQPLSLPCEVNSLSRPPHWEWGKGTQFQTESVSQLYFLLWKAP